MANYDTTKFYWLQLKEDFFNDDAIEWLEEQPNGKEYSLFYLKLCVKSLRTNGVLIRRVGTMLIPYDHVKLGELTKTNPDTVIIALNLLLRIGLVQKLENGELYMTQVEELIGSKSKGAFKKQQQRLNRHLMASGQLEDKCPPKIELKQEEEVEKEKELKNIEPEGSDIVAQEIVSFEEQCFNEFWEAYPKKRNRKGCFIAFKRIKSLKDEFPLLMASLNKFKVSKQWQSANGQFIPYPLTFINQERWKDQDAVTRDEKLNNMDMDGWGI